MRSASLFSQLISLFDRHQFSDLVLEHKAERYSKGFSSWDQFVAMLFCQLAQAHRAALCPIQPPVPGIWIASVRREPGFLNWDNRIMKIQ